MQPIGAGEMQALPSRASDSVGVTDILRGDATNDAGPRLKLPELSTALFPWCTLAKRVSD